MNTPSGFAFYVGEMIHFADGDALATDGIIAAYRIKRGEPWYDVDVRGTLYAVEESRLRRFVEDPAPRRTAEGLQWALAMCFKAACEPGMQSVHQIRLRGFRDRLPNIPHPPTQMRWLMMEIREITHRSEGLPAGALRTLTSAYETIRRMLVNDTPTEVYLRAIREEATSG